MKGYLVGLVRLRHSEHGHWRYEIRMIMGDYYAALHKRERAKWLLKPNKKAKKFYGAAYRYYGRALRIGAEIDTLLECGGRQKEIQARMAELGPALLL